MGWRVSRNVKRESVAAWTLSRHPDGCYEYQWLGESLLACRNVGLEPGRGLAALLGQSTRIFPGRSYTGSVLNPVDIPGRPQLLHAPNGATAAAASITLPVNWWILALSINMHSERNCTLSERACVKKVGSGCVTAAGLWWMSFYLCRLWCLSIVHLSV